MYPRWRIDSGAWWQYLFPLGVMALLIGLWAIRRRVRLPLAALLFFCGTLFPTLGFFNLYAFRYWLVANHYQYLASLGAITLAAVGGASLLRRLGPWPRRAGYLFCMAVLATLAGLAWRQSRMYGDVETLYRDMIAEDPDCWMAHHNLALVLEQRGRIDDAVAHYQRAREINPNVANVYCALGWILERKGKPDDAMVLFQRALAVEPNTALVYFNIGKVLAGRGQLDEAITRLRQALQLAPSCRSQPARDEG
jgi:Flp pilus assembly protein TadD